MHDPRQEGTTEGGRVNQKRRTRTAIVDAARKLLDAGSTPTVAQAAEAALVSRTTAYRYFPTQETLLLEIAAGAGVDEIEAFVARPPDGDPAARTVEVLTRFARHVLEEETRYRTLLRVYQDMWLAAAEAGDDAPVIREGRRARWLERTLAPVADRVPPADLDRLRCALALLAGAEALVVLRDVCRIDDDDAAVEVVRWAARTLVDAVVPDDRG